MDNMKIGNDFHMLQIELILPWRKLFFNRF